MRNARGSQRAACLALGLAIVAAVAAAADDPPAINPFGGAAADRDDAVPGYVELSDGSVHPGQVYLTRETKLKIFDEPEKKFRDVPLRVVKTIDCAVLKEWVEREWRFKENANDEKVYTGRNYPSREYVHTITLDDGRSVRGPLQAIVYVQPEGRKAERYLLHKRDKGEVGTGLEALTYVRSVRLGDQALEEGKQKAAKTRPAPNAGSTKKAAPSPRSRLPRPN
jgi:hypothetical protein